MKAIFWDFDCTLGYNDGKWTGLLTEIANRKYPELGIVREDIRPWMADGRFPWHYPDVEHPGQSPDEWWEELNPMLVRAFRKAGTGEEIAEELARLVRPAYLEPSSWHLYEDTVPCLERLAAMGWTHYILSNHVPELPDIVKLLGIDDLFAEVSTSAETGIEKPNPQAFRLMMSRLPADSDIWMIGDNFTADVKGAEAVGLPAILVRGTNVEAKFSCETLDEVPAILADHDG